MPAGRGYDLEEKRRKANVRDDKKVPQPDLGQQRVRRKPLQGSAPPTPSSGGAKGPVLEGMEKKMRSGPTAMNPQAGPPRPRPPMRPPMASGPTPMSGPPRRRPMPGPPQAGRPQAGPPRPTPQLRPQMRSGPVAMNQGAGPQRSLPQMNPAILRQILSQAGGGRPPGAMAAAPRRPMPQAGRPMPPGRPMPQAGRPMPGMPGRQRLV